jgi:integrase
MGRSSSGRRRPRPADAESPLPRHITPDLLGHLDRFVDVPGEALIFTGEKGGPVRPHVLQKAWAQAKRTVGIEAHLHDLRHAGNT